jgi:hypothetical protein
LQIAINKLPMESEPGTNCEPPAPGVWYFLTSDFCLLSPVVKDVNFASAGAENA